MKRIRIISQTAILALLSLIVISCGDTSFSKVGIEFLDSAFGYSSDLNIYVESETKLDGWSDTWCGDQGSLTCPKIHWGKQCEAGVYENEFVYISFNGEATISSYIGNKSIVEIPSIINGNKVVSFGDIFRENTTITKIVVPSTVVVVLGMAGPTIEIASG